MYFLYISHSQARWDKLCSVVCLRPRQHEEVCSLEQSFFLLVSNVLQAQYFSPVYKCCQNKQKSNFNVHIRGFYTYFNIKWDLVFSLQVHYLETKYVEVKISVLHETCLSILVASSLFSKIVRGGACEAQQTVFCLYPSCDLVMCCALSTSPLGTAEQALNKSN